MVATQEASKTTGSSVTAHRTRLTPQLIVVCVSYFCQGAKTQMAILAERYVMKDLLKFDPAKTELWVSTSKAPWMIKPVFGFISDSFPIRGQHRRPYLVLCGALGFLAYICMSLLGYKSAAGMLANMLAAELSIAVSDVVVDGIVVEQARGEAQGTSGTLQSLCWGSQAVGGLVSATVVGPAISYLGPRAVLLGMAFLPLTVGLVAFLMHEAPALNLSMKHSLSDAEEFDLHRLTGAGRGGAGRAEPADTGWRGRPHSTRASWAAIGSKLATLCRALLLPTVLVPGLYIFLNQGPAGLASALFFFYTEHLNFQPTFMGAVQLLDGAASLAGVLIFNFRLKHVELRTLLLGVTLVCSCVSLTQLLLVTGVNRQLGIPDKLFALADGAVVGAVARIAMMPLFILAARICPVGVEASLYSGLMSVSNAGQGAAGLLVAGTSRLVGVSSTQFGTTWVLILVAQVPNLASLALLPLLPSGSPDVSQQSDGGPPIGVLEVEMRQGAEGVRTDALEPGEDAELLTRR